GGHPRVLRPPRRDVPVHQQPGAVRPPGADVPAAAGARQIVLGPWSSVPGTAPGRATRDQGPGTKDMAQRSSNPWTFLARYWFPLALVVLLLLAIPGLVLFALPLFGGEGAVNDWLQENFQLSYHLPLPWWLALALMLVPLAILLLYFLKLKRKPLQVPSTFLW